MPNKGLKRSCAVCEHPERGRIDYLIVTATGAHGVGHRALGEKFGVPSHSLYRHGRNHITEEYRRAVKIGPFESEEHLRRLCAENGASVLDNFRALYNGHLSRWLATLEVGDDVAMARHGRMMMEMLGRIGLLTKELVPPGAHTAIQQNFYMSADFYTFQRRGLRVLRHHPEAMADWLREFRPEPPEPAALLEASADAA